MNRRHILATAALAAMLCLVVSSCSRAGSNSSQPAKSSGKKSAVMIMSTLNNPFFVSVKNGAQAEAKKKGIKLDVQNANNSDSTELNLATTAATKQPGALILDPVSSQSSTQSVQQANNNNIPALAFDRQPAGGKLTAFIGYDAIKAGKNAADALAKAMGGKGQIAEIQGILGTNVAQDRSKGFEEEIAKTPGIKIVAKQPANFDRGTALNVMTNILQAHAGITGVYAANDEMALGVLAALKARNLVDKVKLVGNDGISDALTAIAQGQMYATNAESPYALGQQIIDITAQVIAGKSVQKNKSLEGELVTKSNVKQYCQKLIGIGDSADCPAAAR